MAVTALVVATVCLGIFTLLLQTSCSAKIGVIVETFTLVLCMCLWEFGVSIAFFTLEFFFYLMFPCVCYSGNDRRLFPSWIRVSQSFYLRDVHHHTILGCFIDDIRNKLGMPDSLHLIIHWRGKRCSLKDLEKSFDELGIEHDTVFHLQLYLLNGGMEGTPIGRAFGKGIKRAASPDSSD